MMVVSFTRSKSLGISNFYGNKLERLLSEAELKPHAVQLEAHPYYTEKEVMDRVKEYGTRKSRRLFFFKGTRGEKFAICCAYQVYSLVNSFTFACFWKNDTP